MNTNSRPAQELAGPSASQQLPRPAKGRPVRRGYFWPGEGFGDCIGTWELYEAFSRHAFQLPTRLGDTNPPTR